MLIDVAYNWRMAKLAERLENRMPMPELDVLQSGSLRSSKNSVYLDWGRWGDDVIIIRDWMAENMPDTKVNGLMFGRIEWHKRRFSTSKKLIGLTFEFTNINDLLLFKLRW